MPPRSITARPRHWGDSSNKLSWLIPELAALLPQAKFVHLVRDGRKVAGSYFRKLGDECYDDRSTAILQAFIDDPARNPAPPPEKKYWWPLPRPIRSVDGCNFARFSQFERIAWHWAEINRVILDSLAALPAARTSFVRLEDLQQSAHAVRELFDFLNLPYRDEHGRDVRAPAQRQPAGRPVARHRSARRLRRHCRQHDGASRLCGTAGICSEILTLIGGRWLPGAFPDTVDEQPLRTLPPATRSNPSMKPEGSGRGLKIHLCRHCGLVQSLPRIDRAPRRSAAVSSGADWGNVRYGKGFRTKQRFGAP